MHNTCVTLGLVKRVLMLVGSHSGSTQYQLRDVPGLPRETRLGRVARTAI